MHKFYYKYDNLDQNYERSINVYFNWIKFCRVLEILIPYLELAFAKHLDFGKKFGYIILLDIANFTSKFA